MLHSEQKCEQKTEMCTFLFVKLVYYGTLQSKNQSAIYWPCGKGIYRPPMDSPPQMASNAKRDSMSCRYRGSRSFSINVERMTFDMAWRCHALFTWKFGVSNHRQRDCLLKCLFRLTKPSTCHFDGKPLMTGGSPSLWRHKGPAIQKVIPCHRPSC